jgi:hypothetical protein
MRRLESEQYDSTNIVKGQTKRLWRVRSGISWHQSRTVGRFAQRMMTWTWMILFWSTFLRTKYIQRDIIFGFCIIKIVEKCCTQGKVVLGRHLVVWVRSKCDSCEEKPKTRLAGFARRSEWWAETDKRLLWKELVSSIRVFERYALYLKKSLSWRTTRTWRQVLWIIIRAFRPLFSGHERFEFNNLMI